MLKTKEELQLEKALARERGKAIRAKERKQRHRHLKRALKREKKLKDAANARAIALAQALGLPTVPTLNEIYLAKQKHREERTLLKKGVLPVTL